MNDLRFRISDEAQAKATKLQTLLADIGLNIDQAYALMMLIQETDEDGLLPEYSAPASLDDQDVEDWLTGRQEDADAMMSDILSEVPSLITEA